MTIIIKHRDTNEALHTSEAATLREAVEEAVRQGKNLCGADLEGAKLYGANLRGAKLYGANLCGANLCGADLRSADLCGANLRSADLYGAKGLPVVPIVERLDAQILDRIEAGGHLDMSTWHTCETTHCRAGWAIALAGAEGSALERAVGPSAAGALIYFASTGSVPNFFASNEDAMRDIKEKAGVAE
jgi:hypothetical protein